MVSEPVFLQLFIGRIYILLGPWSVPFHTFATSGLNGSSFNYLINKHGSSLSKEKTVLNIDEAKKKFQNIGYISYHTQFVNSQLGSNIEELNQLYAMYE